MVIVLLGLVFVLPVVVTAQEPAYVSLDDMEGDVGSRWHDVGGSAKTTLEPDDKIVKEGETSGRWDIDSSAQAIYIAAPAIPTDWEQFGALEMWVHSERPTGAVFAIVLDSPNSSTEGEDYYRCLVVVDWEGWRLLHLEPRSFAIARRPIGWRHIHALRIAIAGWNDLKRVPGTVLRFDALRLTRSLSSPSHRILFEPDTDWCAWWPLSYSTTPANTGRYVSEWLPAKDGPTVYNRSVIRDWSGSAYLNMWVYCEETPGMVLQVNVGSDRPETGDADGYETRVPLDWVGWKLLELPLTELRRCGEPLGWQAIEELRLTVHSEDQLRPTARICLDDIWLTTTRGGLASPTTHQTPAPPAATPPPPTMVAPGPEAAPPLPPVPEAIDIERLLREALEAKRKGDLELAFTKYVAVLLKEPSSVDAHWGLAWVLASKGEKEAAIEHFEKVVELSPDPQRKKEAQAALGRLRSGKKP